MVQEFCDGSCPLTGNAAFDLGRAPDTSPPAGGPVRVFASPGDVGKRNEEYWGRFSHKPKTGRMPTTNAMDGQLKDIQNAKIRGLGVSSAKISPNSRLAPLPKKGQKNFDPLDTSPQESSSTPSEGSLQAKESEGKNLHQ